MKQTKTKLLYLLLAALMLLSLTACGKNKESTDKELADSNLLKLGDYELLYKGACIMEDSDGNDAVVLTLDFTNNGEDSHSYLWSISETAMQNGVELAVAIVYSNPDSDDATVIEDQFTDVAPGATLEIRTAFVLADTTSKVEVTFEEAFGDKNGKITVDPSTLSRESAGSGTAQSAGTGDALLDWWNGDWYGWWIMTGCSGYYEDKGMEGAWWDICGAVDIGADGMGTVILWDGDYTKSEPMVSASVSLSGNGTSIYGTMMSEGGFFTDIALKHADWIVDPGLADYGDMIHIDGDYENSGDEFHYDIYLRPWGTYWVDVDEEDLPDLYDTWYLPLIDAGKSMPDAIGEDAPEEVVPTEGAPLTPTDAMASGGDGIVTEEQVQKGYVWMNEVNNNIFDATYEDIVAYFGVEGQFVKEEYSDHMKANYRYYKWISEDDDSHFIYVNFKENESGVYTVSAYNTSGFSGTEAIEKYLDIVKAEAAEANKAASANAEMKDFSVEIAQFAKDDVKVKIMTKIPVSGWSYDEGPRCLVENDDPTAFGAGAIRFEVRTNVEDFDYYKDKFENYQDIEDRVIGGITFHGRTYKYIGYEWIEYIAQIDDTRALSIGLRNMDCVQGTMPDIILTNMKFQ